MRVAAHPGSYVMGALHLAKIDVLVLDDWGFAPLREQERRDMLEIFR
jgi:DNA replication protein DnaC